MQMRHSMKHGGLASGLLYFCIAWMGVAGAQDRPPAQIKFENDYLAIVGRIAAAEQKFDESRNEIGLKKRLADIEATKTNLRNGLGNVTDWVCPIQEIFESSAAYDPRLRRGPNTYHLVVCGSSQSPRYLVLYDGCPSSLDKLPKVQKDRCERLLGKLATDQRVLKFSGTFGKFPAVAAFHSSLQPLTFIARADD
jgi:hypothetical protein